MTASETGRLRQAFWLLPALLLALQLGSSQCRAQVVIEQLDSRGVLHRAGALEGDSIEAWSVESSSSRQTPIRSFVDWRYVVDEIHPLPGPVILSIRRGPEIRSIEVHDGNVISRVRPRLAADALEAFRAGAEAKAAGRGAEAFDRWQSLFAARVEVGDFDGAGWLAEILAQEAGPEQLDAARSALETAWSMPGSGWRFKAQLLVTRATLVLRVGDAAAALPDLESALALRRELSVEGLGVECLGVECLGSARVLYLLGYTALGTGDPASAQGFYRQALDLYRRELPDTLVEAAAHIGLGQAEAQLGRLREAESEWRRALELYDQLKPNSPDRAGILNNLGILSSYAGDWRRAEGYFERSLELDGAAQLDKLQRGRVLNNLGELALRRSAFDLAETRFREALAVKEAQAPDDPIVATSLTGLGQVAYERNDLDRAAEYFGRVLAFMQANRPGTLLEATALSRDARVRLRRGEIDGAEAEHRHALAILETVAPEGLVVADTWRWLGEVARDRGDLKSAAERFDEARKRLEATLGDTAGLAEVLGDLAEIRRRQGDRAAALELSWHAVEALEGQLRRFGAAPDSRSRFRSNHDELYRRLIELLVESGDVETAFGVVERSRARGLLELLSSRSLHLRDALPELEEERLALVAAEDALAHRLATTTPSAPERPAHLGELAELRQIRQQLADTTWRLSPRVAAWRSPRPLDSEAARQALEPGTLLLAWSVGTERTTLFAVRRDQPIRAVTLPLSDQDLEHRVRRFVEWIRRSGESGARSASPWQAEAQQLGEDLLGPVASEIRGAQRLLLSPDGPLHPLPFAALKLPATSGDSKFLIAFGPITYTGSITVLAELRRRAAADPAASTAASAVAFGATAANPATGQPLAGAGAEARAVAALFPDGVAFVGPAATEEQWMASAPGARWLHFAGHALVDPASPLDSALLFSVPKTISEGGENGVLEAWEVFEELQLDADMVVLSGCGTALGESVRGEGLLGLERAFLYAGARSVVASLWPISDRVTRQLMGRFYRHLSAGVERDEALRRAQLETIEAGAADGESAAPAHWAAFRLTG